MSDIQKIISAIADELHNETIHASDLLRIVAMLNGIPSCYHKEAVLAALCVKEEDDAE